MEMNPRTVTMKEVAARAQVSVSTVSLALSGSPLVAERTRDRVVAMADQLGYRPNPLLTALMRSRRSRTKTALQPTLALLTDHPERDGWKISPTLRAFERAAFVRVQLRGYRMEAFWRREAHMTDRRLDEILQSRGIRGILLFPSANPQAKLDLDWSAYATIALGFTLGGQAFDRVAGDHYRAMRLAFREAWRAGYRKIAFAALEHMNERVDQRWLAGYLTALRQSPGRPAERLLLQPEWNPEVVREWFRAEAPDCIITDSTDFFLPWLRAEGIPVPDTVGLVSINLPDGHEQTAGILQQPERQAQNAIDFLITKITHQEFGVPDPPTNTLIEGQWKPGSTLRAVRT